MYDKLLPKNPKIIDEPNFDGWTCLHIGAAKLSDEIVHFGVEHGATVNVKSNIFLFHFSVSSLPLFSPCFTPLSLLFLLDYSVGGLVYSPSYHPLVNYFIFCSIFER
jgi:ankyrin repeat protein